MLFGWDVYFPIQLLPLFRNALIDQEGLPWFIVPDLIDT